jgi:hypothetical protein
MVLFGLVLRFLVDVHRSSMFWCHDYGKLLRLLCQHVRTMAPVLEFSVSWRFDRNSVRCKEGARVRVCDFVLCLCAPILLGTWAPRPILLGKMRRVVLRNRRSEIYEKRKLPEHGRYADGGDEEDDEDDPRRSSSQKGKDEYKRILNPMWTIRTQPSQYAQ